METLQSKKEEVLSAYNEGDSGVRKVLEQLFGKQNLNPVKITDRVKTLDDALKICPPTENMKILLDYNGTDEDMLAAKAFLQLTLIAKALNEGWTPDWNNDDEYKYFPFFRLSGSGLVYYDFGYALTFTYVGSRLCFKSEELAEYAGKQFESIYKTYLTLNK